MSDDKKYSEKTEVKTETKRSGTPESDKQEVKEETTVKTERKVEKEDDTVVIVE